MPVLRELRRILSDDGVLRIIVPDVRTFVDAYLRSDTEWFARVGMHDTSTPAAGLNGVFQDHFHRFVDDFDSLRLALAQAGFTRVERSAPGESAHLDVQVDRFEESRTLCSLYVDAQP